jgi:hypothetical protein
MTGLLDKLNLRPGERRLVVIVALVVFVMLNLWLVWPQFGKVGFWDQKRVDAAKKLKAIQDEVNRRPQYERDLKALEQQGGQVASDEMALAFQQKITAQATMSQVLVEDYGPVTRGSGVRTNAFFEEQSQSVRVNTGEKELVDLLYNLGARNELIRVRTMQLSPEPTRMKLKGTIGLVMSFQKKPPPRSVAAATGAAKTTNPAVVAPQPAAPAKPNTTAKTNAPRATPAPPTPAPPKKP